MRLGSLWHCPWRVRRGSPLLLATVVLLGLGSAVPAARAAEEAGVVRQLTPDQDRIGNHLWIDFVSSGRGQHYRLDSSLEGGDREREITVARAAQVLTLGFELERKWFSFRIIDSLWEGGQIRVPGAPHPRPGYSIFTSPQITFSIRPVKMLRLDLEAEYYFAFDTADDPEFFSYHAIMGAFHVVFEPWRSYFGGAPRFELAAGIKGGYALGRHDAGEGEPSKDYTGYGLSYGLRARIAFPILDDVAIFMGLGYYIDAPHTGDLFSSGEALEYGNLEWMLCLRYFPTGR